MEQNSTHLTLYTLLSLKTCILLVGEHPNTNQQLPSGDCTIAQGMFFKAYQCNRHSTICIEKKSTIKGAQWNPSTAKIHNFSWKIVSKDSSLIGTKASCNQAQSDLRLKPPNKIFHKKKALGMLFFHPQHLPTCYFSRYNPNQRSSSERTQQV